WQLLRWLGNRVPGPKAGDTDGTVQSPNPISRLYQWKIVDNLRRSLLPVATFAWLIAGWTVLPGHALAWTLAALLSIAFPLGFGLFLDGIDPPRREVPRSWGPFYGAIWGDARNAAKQFALAILFL